jgi:hypothetical protein
MTSVNLDIPVAADLQQAFDVPPCSELSIPMPSPLKITLPSGDELKAFTDLSKGIPNDCSMTFNLVLQLAPFLASITCLLRLLKLIKPLVDIVQGLTKKPPAPPVAAVEEFAAAAIDLAPCFLMPAGVIPFAKDIICFIRALLNCLLTQLKSVRDLLEGIGLRIEAAAGNEDLLAALQCAQQNAQTSAASLSQAIDPISTLLELANPIMEMAGMPTISLTPPAAGAADLAGLNAVIETLQDVVSTIDALGICGT